MPSRTIRSVQVVAPAVVALVALQVGLHRASADVLTPEIAVGLESVRDVAISPDGGTIAYTLSVPREPDEEPGGSYAEIWLVGAEGGDARRFTAPKLNSHSPAWSPDGATLAFLSTREDQSEHTQIYLISLTGGEARMLTEHETSVSSFEWSPDGRRIAFTARDTRTEEEKKAEEEGRDWTVFGADDRHMRLWIVDVETGEARPVYDDGLSTSNYAWVPSGETVVFQAAESPDIDAGMMYQRIYRVGLSESSDPAVLCKTQGKLGSMAVSPDGSTLAFQGATSLNDPLPQSLFVVPTDGSEARNLTEGLQASAAQVDWLEDGTAVMLVDEGTGSAMYAVEAETGASSLLIRTDVVIGEFSMARDQQRFAVAASSGEHGDDVYVSNGTNTLTRLTRHNPVLETLELAYEETIEWEGADGWRIEGVLTYPVGYQPGQSYPLIVNPHGGPEGVSQTGFNTFPQLLAARGYLVLQPNYRGSSGRGVAFSKGDHNDLGGTEYTDIINGVDELIARGLADPDRVGSAGWSYGGFLSAFAATHYSHRYKAAVMGAGISNWISFAGTTDIPHEMQIVHWNQWWQDDPEIQWQRSPLGAIENANTPTLILHGMNDARVHPEQALQMYHALKHRDVPVELVLYPRATHGVSERAHRLDLYERQLAWFDRYVKGEG